MTNNNNNNGTSDSTPSEVTEAVASVEETSVIPTPDAITSLTEEVKASFLKDLHQRAENLIPPKLDIYELGPWSPSKVKTLQKCPFQFYLKYILKFKVPSHYQIQDDPVSAPVGTAAHLILEKLLLGKSMDKAFAEVKKENLDKKILTLPQWSERVETLHYNIGQFKERMDELGRRHPIKRVLTELNIGVTRNYQSTGFFSNDVWLRGIVDLVVMLECMDIIIIDHKTGGGEGSIKNYTSQLDWYKVLFHYGINKIKGAQTAIHFIRAGDVKMADYSHSADIENKLRNVIEITIEGAVDSLIEKGYFKHVRGSSCKWCEYDAIGCKSGELKPLELASKKWIQLHLEKPKCQETIDSPVPVK